MTDRPAVLTPEADLDAGEAAPTGDGPSPPPPKASVRPSTRSTVREYAEAIGIALVIALLLRSFVVEAFKIPSGSMIPTLQIGDHIFVNKMAYRSEVPYSLLGVRIPAGGTTLKQWGLPERGDVVVFRYPSQPDVDYIKRVIGLPGDTVEVRDNDLYVNGRKLAREYRDAYGYVDQRCQEESASLFEERAGSRAFTVLLHDGPDPYEDFGPVAVRPGHLFVMGDNRDNSSDSRVWGQVPVDNVKGRAMVTWLSLNPCGGPLGLFRVSRMFDVIH